MDLADSLRTSTGAGERRPRRVVVAAVLACAYAVVVAGVAVILLWELITGTGNIGHQQLEPIEVRVVVGFSALLLAFAALLVIGGARLHAGRGRYVLVIPLLLFLLFGLVGETHDIATGEGLLSNTIGAVILALAAIPVAIAFTPPTRAWLASTNRP